MKKSLITALVLGLMAASLVGTADAKKAFKGELDFYLHWTDDGNCGGPQYMDLEDTPGDAGCTFIFQAAQEALIASGQGALTQAFPATDGLPFKLNAKKGLKGTIALSLLGSPTGSIDLRVAGLTKKGSAVLVEENFPFAPTPFGTVEIPLDVKLPKKFDGQVFESLTTEITVRGVSVQASVQMESPASHVTVFGK